MSDDRDRVTVHACALLRGDLPALRPDTAAAVDAALAEALTGDDVTAVAARIRQIADEARVGPRLRAYEEDLIHGRLPEVRAAGWRGESYQGLPGDPVMAPPIWTCPEPPAGHFRRVQYGPRDTVGECAQHHVDLVPETTP